MFQRQHRPRLECVGRASPHRNRGSGRIDPNVLDKARAEDVEDERASRQTSGRQQPSAPIHHAHPRNRLPLPSSPGDAHRPARANVVLREDRVGARPAGQRGSRCSWAGRMPCARVGQKIRGIRVTPHSAFGPPSPAPVRVPKSSDPGLAPHPPTCGANDVYLVPHTCSMTQCFPKCSCLLLNTYLTLLPPP
jgi:hypothetical protein